MKTIIMLIHSQHHPPQLNTSRSSANSSSSPSVGAKLSSSTFDSVNQHGLYVCCGSWNKTSDFSEQVDSWLFVKGQLVFIWFNSCQCKNDVSHCRLKRKRIILVLWGDFRRLRLHQGWSLMVYLLLYSLLIRRTLLLILLSEVLKIQKNVWNKKQVITLVLLSRFG